jgi:hypothetical protein
MHGLQPNQNEKISFSFENFEKVFKKSIPGEQFPLNFKIDKNQPWIGYR